MPDLTPVEAIESVVDRLTAQLVEREAAAVDDEPAVKRIRQQLAALYQRRAELMSVDIKPAESTAPPFTKGARR